MGQPRYTRYVTSRDIAPWRWLALGWLTVGLLATGCGDNRTLGTGEDGGGAETSVAVDQAAPPEAAIHQDDGPLPADHALYKDVLQQTHEVIYGVQWPTLVLVAETSASMTQALLGTSKTSAWTVMQKIVGILNMNSLPIRYGLVTYNNTAYTSVPPPKANYSNLGAIKAAMHWSYNSGLNNTAAGLQAARKLLGQHPGAPRHLVLVNTDIPTAATGCKSNSSCCVSSAHAESALVRSGAKAALHTVEIRRNGHPKALTSFLTQISGVAGSKGNDASMRHVVADNKGVDALINGITRSACALGPLPVSPGASAPKKVKVYFRNTNGKLKQVPQVANRDAFPLKPGFEYHVNGSHALVIPTVKTCNDLGYMPQNRIVVRW